MKKSCFLVSITYVFLQLYCSNYLQVREIIVTASHNEADSHRPQEHSITAHFRFSRQLAFTFTSSACWQNETVADTRCMDCLGRELAFCVAIYYKRVTDTEIKLVISDERRCGTRMNVKTPFRLPTISESTPHHDPDTRLMRIIIPTSGRDSGYAANNACLLT